MENKEQIKPKYEWVVEENVNDITPVRRKIAKTMEVTETFNYYDTLAYVMKMEKAIEDKLAEVDGLRSMLEAYKAELELIDSELGVTEEEEKWNKELHEKLKAEAEAKESEEAKEDSNELIESPYVTEDNSAN